MAGLRPVKLFAIILMVATGCLASASDPGFAQAPPATNAASSSDAILLTIFLRHDQSKTLDEINDHLKKIGWYDKFPPQGVEIVSW
jgi:hypothetical protein